MRPQPPAISIHRNDSAGFLQALLDPSHAEFQNKGAHDFVRHHLTAQQLFAAQAEHEIEALTTPFERPIDMSAHSLLTDAGFSRLIHAGRQIPRGLIHPNSAAPEDQIRITEAQAFVALQILNQLRRWSAARGCRMVLFTHSALWGREADEKRGIEEHHGALYGICSFAHYKKALKLLALVGMPVLHINHETEDGRLTQESRCLGIILPALPRNANVDRSINLPAASLERILAPGEQMAFNAVSADPGDPEKADAMQRCNPPQSSTALRVKVGQHQSRQRRPNFEIPLAASHQARRPNESSSNEIPPEGLTESGRENLRPFRIPARSVLNSQRPEDLARAPDWRLLRSIWNEAEHLTRASLYGSQIPTMTRQVHALCSLLGTEAFIAAARAWVDSLDQQFHFGDGPLPHFSWSFGFLRQLSHSTHRDILSEPSCAPTEKTRHAFHQALRPELVLLGQSAATLELLALTRPNGAGETFVVVAGNHQAWQFVMHHPIGAKLVSSAAAAVDATGFVFVGDRHIDLAKTRQLVRSAMHVDSSRYFRIDRTALAAARTIDEISDARSRLQRSLERFNDQASTPLPEFPIRHTGGRKFTLDLEQRITDDWFALRYRRAYTDLIERTFADELAGVAPELETMNAAGSTN